VRTGNVKFRYCKVHLSYQGVSGADTGIFKCTNTGLPHAWDAVTVENCDIFMDVPTFLIDGFLGHGFTAKYNNIYHVVDGFGTQVSFGSGLPAAFVKMIGNWVHDMQYIEGKFAPASSYTSGGSPSNSGIVVNNFGNDEKPDGSHNDCWQPQNGSDQIADGNVFDGRLDYSNVGGVTPWMRQNLGFLVSDPAGNSQGPVWGTHNGNSAIQINNVTSTSPCKRLQIINNELIGGRFATLNIGPNNGYGYGTGADAMIVQNNRVFDTIPAGYTIPPWASSGDFGQYSTGGVFVPGAVAQSQSPGYPEGTSDGSSVVSAIVKGGNVLADGVTPMPWRGVSSTIIATG
jgi:hypothetical protein